MRAGLPRLAPPGSTADTLSAIGWIIAAFAMLVIATALYSVLTSRRFRHLDTKLTTKLGGIEVAVNNVPEGAPTLVQQVTWLFGAVEAIATQAGYDLPEKPTPTPRTARTRKEDS